MIEAIYFLAATHKLGVIWAEMQKQEDRLDNDEPDKAASAHYQCLQLWPASRGCNPCQVHRAVKCLLRIMATVSKLRRMLIENLEASLTTDWQGRIFLLPMNRNLQTALR